MVWRCVYYCGTNKPSDQMPDREQLARQAAAEVAHTPDASTRNHEEGLPHGDSAAPHNPPHSPTHDPEPVDATPQGSRSNTPEDTCLAREEARREEAQKQ